MKSRLSIRFRLTAWYAATLLTVGVALLGVAYLLVGRSLTDYQRDSAAGIEQHVRERIARDFPEGDALPPLGPGDLISAAERRRIEETVRDRELRAVTGRLLAVLGGLVVVSVLGGWVVAGRALRPVARITATARRVADGRLHERIALDGPHDELKELADTFDVMLERLQSVFDEQREFVDSASHELRTPLAIMRAALDDVRDGAADEVQLRRAVEVVSAAVDRSEQLAGGLLLLARSDRELQARVDVDLGELCTAALEHHSPSAAAAGVDPRSGIDEARTRGDPVLLEQMVDNLLVNAIRYNHAGGWLSIRCRDTESRVILEVENTGRDVPAEDVPRLFTAFVRLERSRDRDSGGAGLGLAIVSRIVRAHSGTVTARARMGGGLIIAVELPAA